MISANSINYRQITPRWEDDSVEYGSKAHSTSLMNDTVSHLSHLANRKPENGGGFTNRSAESLEEDELRDEMKDQFVVDQNHDQVIQNRQKDFKDMEAWQQEIRQIQNQE